jgi:ParB family transcriptional regulator, chromosome partitioning protein
MMKKALGKGLGAFIPEEFGIIKEERYIELNIEQVKPNPKQPRVVFDDEALTELSQSIKETGIVQPILVVPEDGFYKIIVGERRWRAAQRAGLKKIPALIRNLSPEQQLEISIIENIHREDLNPMELALAYQKMSDELNFTQQEIAEKVGKDRSSVTNYMRLLKLPKEIQDSLFKEDLSMGHARALLAIEDPDVLAIAFKHVIDKSLSVRNTEKLVNSYKEKPPRAQRNLADPDLNALQEEFIKALGTKVLISGNRNKGVIKIFYFSLDDLNRIYNKLKGAQQ